MSEVEQPGLKGAPAGPAMVLVEPQMGENIGAAARGMWNFGLRSMRIVNPRDAWPNPAAVAMASGATGVLDEARLFPTTAEAVADMHWLLATTARPRELTKRVLTPEAAMAEARDRIASGERVGVLFGRERTGLENDDVLRANAVVTVPVNPAFASLNLAQCVLLMSYEWRRQTDATPPDRLAGGATEPATAQAVERMLVHLEEELDQAGFFFPAEKRPATVAKLRNLFRRTPLTEAEVSTLRGAIRALAEGPKRRRGPNRH